MAISEVRLGVLIDADNTSGTHAKAILDELATYGLVTIKRAYGDWTTNQLVGWKKALVDHAIQPIQQFANTTGKNATDSALIIDAMDLLYAGNLDAFALVSSDSDFTRLAGRLRESGKTVYGIGERKTPASLIAACDKFVFLEVLTRQHSDGAGHGDPEAAPLRPLLNNAIDATSQEDGWAHLAAVGSQLSKLSASFDARNYGFAKLITLVRAQSYLEVEQTASNVTRVRLRPTRQTSGKTSTSSTGTSAEKAAKKSAS